MKKIIIAALATVALPAAAMAQTVTPGTTTTVQTTTTTAGRVDYVARQSMDQMLASSLIGTTVRGPADENVGEINDVLVSKDGKIDAVVIGVGGFLGIGEKDVAVPFMALEANHDAKNPNKLTMRIASTKEALKAAPEFVKADAVASTTTTTTTPGATGAGQPRTPLSPSAPPAATAPAPTPVTPK